MKLTTEQINTIDATLVLNGLIYDDIKLEVTDHIASEIELKMEENNIPFEDALKTAFENWKEQSRPSSLFWMGSKKVAPRIVIEKWKSIYRKQYKFSLLSVVVFSIMMTTVTILNPHEHIYNALKLIFASVYFLLCLTIISGLVYIHKLKSKTIYGNFFQIDSIYLGLHFSKIYTFFNGHGRLYRYYNTESFILHFFDWFFDGIFFFMAVYSVMVAIEHFKTVKKYKLV